MHLDIYIMEILGFVTSQPNTETFSGIKQQVTQKQCHILRLCDGYAK